MLLETTSHPNLLCLQNYSGELNYLVALHELYKYINKYYDQVRPVVICVLSSGTKQSLKHAECFTMCLYMKDKNQQRDVMKQ